MTLLNLLLAFIARIIFVAVALPGFIVSTLLAKDRAKYFLNIAISYDQLGGAVLGPLFNLLLRKKGGYDFGDPDVTISAGLGRNKKLNKLTLLGRGLADLLNWIDPDHVEKAKS